MIKKKFLIFFLLVTISFLFIGNVLGKEVEKSNPRKVGIEAFQNQNYQKAVNELKKALKIVSNKAGVYYFLGVSYKELGETKKAKENLQKAKELFKSQLEENKRTIESINKILNNISSKK